MEDEQGEVDDLDDKIHPKPVKTGKTLKLLLMLYISLLILSLPQKIMFHMQLYCNKYLN